MTRQEYTKRAQKNYYDRIRNDPVKWRLHLDKSRAYQQRRKEKLKKEKEEQQKKDTEIKEKIDLEKKKEELQNLIDAGLIKINNNSIV